MHRLILTIVFVSFRYLTFGQIISINEPSSINGIILGKSTIPDAIKEFGDNYKLIVLKDFKTWEQNSGYQKNKGIEFPEKGLTFQCYDTTEIIVAVTMIKPFIGVTLKGLTLKLDSTNNKDLFQYYSDLAWSTTNASE